jgi:Ca-activated chloride channel family protein
MDARITLERTMLAIEQDESVHVLLELEAPQQPAGADRPALDVVAVVDRSGSMAGEPLAAAKDAVQRLLRLLGPEDRLAVVSYDDRVDLVLGLTRHHAGIAANAVASIEVGGSTNLAGGWLKAFEILAADGRPDALRTALLLTDGQANVGMTAPEALAGLCADARRRGVRTSTVGLGEGFDEVLLGAMADAGHGNAHFAGSAEDLPGIFATEFSDLASVVAHNVSVEIRPGADVDLVEVYGERTMVPVEQGVQLSLGDAYGGESRRLVFALGVPGLRELGPAVVGEVVLRYATVDAGAELHTVTMPIVVNVVEGGATDGPNPDVTEEVLRLRAADARRKARDRIIDGDVEGAADMLRSTAADLRSYADAVDDAATRAEADELVIQAEAFAKETAAYSSKSLYRDARLRYDGRKRRPS